MKRVLTYLAMVVCAALVVPAVRADVKTREKSLVTFEGMLGGAMRMFGGKAANDGITSTVALKGDRKMSLSDLTGQIVDLTEQKVYALDVKKKEYTVSTFAELRAELEKAKAEAKAAAEKQAKAAKPEEKEQMDQAAKQLEFDVTVKETGEKKTIAGFDTHEVVMTMSGHEKGKTLEAAGGFVLTSDMWLGPKIAALDELAQFELKYLRAVYGDAAMADAQQMASMVAMYPAFQSMSARMQAEGKKMQGTPVSTIVTFESVKSAEQMKATEEQQPAAGSGGGLGGMLGRRLGGNRGGAPQARSKIMTTTREMLSVDTSVGAADLAIPAGYKEKKK